MILIIHIFCGFVGIISATYQLLQKSNQALFVTICSLALTWASGALLVVMKPGILVHLCIVGFGYTLATLAITTIARYRHKQMATEIRQKF